MKRSMPWALAIAFIKTGAHAERQGLTQVEADVRQDDPNKPAQRFKRIFKSQPLSTVKAPAKNRCQVGALHAV